MRGNAGFTLLEMVLVLVLAGMVSMILGSSLSRMNLLEDDLTGCANRLREAVVHARTRALLLRDGSAVLTVSRDGFEYADAAEARSRKWEGAVVTSNPAALTFDGYGRCTSCVQPVQVEFESVDGKNALSLVIYETGFVGSPKDR